jgi:hypothetical protein
VALFAGKLGNRAVEMISQSEATIAMTSPAVAAPVRPAGRGPGGMTPGGGTTPCGVLPGYAHGGGVPAAW